MNLARKILKTATLCDSIKQAIKYIMKRLKGEKIWIYREKSIRIPNRKEKTG